MSKITPIAALLLSLGALTALAQDGAELPRTAAPEGAAVYILSPTDGAELRSQFTVRFGLRGMGVAPAGVEAPNTGHHHLLIDVDALPPER
jgi:hypothetical protein